MGIRQGVGLARTVRMVSGVLIAAMLVLAAVVWVRTGAIEGHAHQIHTSRAPQLLRIAELELGVTRASLYLRHAILARTPEERKTASTKCARWRASCGPS